jgi:hypothetical protein
VIKSDRSCENKCTRNKGDTYKAGGRFHLDFRRIKKRISCADLMEKKKRL